jgi:HEAT repeat protein
MEGFLPFLPVALAAAVIAWASLATVTVVGRLGFERRRRLAVLQPASVRSSPGRSRRLVARAEHHRGEASKWKRIAALRTLAREGHPRSRALLRWAVADPDRDVAGAAVRALGEIDDEWAAELLVEALRENRYPRALAAAQLERRTPAPTSLFVPLLSDRDPAVRFWGATLMAGSPEVAGDELIALATDADPNVRAAATESLGARSDPGALAAVRPRLADEVWFVRVHACRALGQLGSPGDAPILASMLGDPWWWVRAAAKDALRSLGLSVAATLLPQLESDDAFVRNGAAEVLQDIGFLDSLARTGKEGELRERILAAGGEDMRQTADTRARDDALTALDWRTGS